MNQNFPTNSDFWAAENNWNDAIAKTICDTHNKVQKLILKLVN